MAAMQNFAKQAFDENYAPVAWNDKKKKQKLPLNLWLYNDLASMDNDQRSSFIRNLTTKPRLAQKPIEDNNPSQTATLMKVYNEYFGSGKGVKIDWSLQNKRKFVQASEMLIDYFRDRRISSVWSTKINMAPNADYMRARYMMESIKFSLDDDEDKLARVQPSWLCTDSMFNVRLEQYMKNNRMLQDPNIMGS